MPASSFDLSAARILVTNDDGINAPGLKVLERVAKSLSKDVWVVAPETEQSAASHSLTLRRPLRQRKVGRRRFSVDGTPTDCVLVAVRSILKARPPDLVLSGVNEGSNLGEDVIYSGTVAAAMEAALLGIPAAALSQARPPDRVVHWATAEKFAPDILRKLMANPWPKDTLVNINFPGLPPQQVGPVVACRQGRRVEGTQVMTGMDPGGRPYLWVGNFQSDATHDKGTDLAAIAGNSISLTPLHLDRTHRAALKQMTAVFG